MHENASTLDISIILFADQTVEVNSFIQTMLRINATFELVTFYYTKHDETLVHFQYNNIPFKRLL